MGSLMKQFLGTVTMLALVALALSPIDSFGQAVDLAAAKKEGRVVVYGTPPPKSMDVLNRAFQKKYGIQVDYWRASATKVMDRAVTEWRAGRPGFDVVESSRGTHLIMKDNGLFTKFTPVTAQKFPKEFLEKDGLITPWRFLPISILYNTQLVKPADVPKRFEDLLDPKWNKRIALPDPSRHTTTAQFLRNLETLMGEKWLDYVKGLAKQQPHLVESLAPVTDVIIRGEAPVGITYVKYVVQYKGPTDYVLMDKHLAESNYLAVGAKAANPNAARLYIEFTTSAEGQRIIAEREGEFVLYPGITPKIREAEKVSKGSIFMDTPTEEEFRKLREQFHQIFVAK